MDKELQETKLHYKRLYTRTIFQTKRKDYGQEIQKE